jgi:hypothetical protein
LSNLGTLLVFVAACSFETQPIFSPPPSALTAIDAGTGQKTGATQGAAGAVPVADAGTPRSDAATPPPPPPPVGNDAGLTSCQPGEISMCLLGTQIICNSLGTGVTFSSCAGLGCSADNKHCNGCTPGQLSCRDANTLVTCAADGHATTQTCPMGCSATPAGAACNGCVPGSTSCADAHTLRTCDANGVNADSPCAMGCGTDSGVAACRVCTPSMASCQGTQLVQCSATGKIASSTTCPHGCDATTAQCTAARLVPANLPADTCATPATEAGDFSDDAIIDTDNDCSDVVQQPAGAPEICVLRYLNLKILAGVTVRARGSRVLALVAMHSMTIDGTLTAGAQGTMAGPGAFSTGVGVGLDGVARADGMMNPTDIPANAGGGGAGYAVKGASGGDAPGMCMGMGPAGCADPGGGGMRYGAETIVPLVGGSRGGHNSAAAGSSRLAVAGGGGGALQLISCGDMTVGAAALIDAAGGGGSGGLVGSNSGESKTPGAGAGGGSGGAILLEALSFHLRAGASLAANGGGGGGGAVRGSSGMGNGNGNSNDPAPGQPGQDGHRGTMPAAGGDAGGGNSRAGGAGGTTLAPTAGGTVDDIESAAGGGGGAAGRIRIDGPTGGVDQTGVVTSPRPSVGVVAID